MNSFDIIVVVILSFCVIRGVFRGLIKELSSIIGVLGGYYFAYSYYMVLAKFLSRWISNTSYLNILSFLIIFSGILILIGIIGVVIKYVLKIAYMGWIDRICGAGFGITKGILIVSVLLITLTAFLPRNTPVIKNSSLAPYVTMISENMAKIISPVMKRDFKSKITALKRTWYKKR